MIPQRLEEPALVWQRLMHPNVSEFYGLSFKFGYMPALVLPFYGNGNVVDHVRQKDDDAKLDMVLIFCSFVTRNTTKECLSGEADCRRVELPARELHHPRGYSGRKSI